MTLARAYIETSIVSYLAGRPSRDLVAAAHQQVTHDWWASQRPLFDCVVSGFVLDEIGRGDAQAASLRAHWVADLAVLPLSDAVETLGIFLCEQGALPAQARTDAFHIASAAVGGCEYLLTWNCTHIANAVMRPKIEALCLASGFAAPRMCTPLELMEG